MEKSVVPVVCIVFALAGCGTVKSISTTGAMSPAHPLDYAYGRSDDELKAALKPLRCELLQLEAEYYGDTNFPDVTAAPKQSGSDSSSPNATSQSDQCQLTRVANPREPKQVRNEIVQKLRTPIDELWRRYQSAFWGDVAAMKSGLSVASTTASAGALMTTPPSAAKVVNLFAGIFSSLSAATDSSFLNSQTLPVIYQQIQADMVLYGTKIDQGLQEPVDTYPLATAYADLAKYSESMSIPHAVTALAAKAGAQAQKVTDEVAATVTAKANRAAADNANAAAQANLEAATKERRAAQLKEEATKLQRAPASKNQ